MLFDDGLAIGPVSAASDTEAVAHEFGHGIVEAETGIKDASGPVDGAAALSEGFADFASVVTDVHLHGMVGENPWKIGSTQTLRNWHFPTSVNPLFRDWFPTRWTILNGYTHENSTILGHAFYLLAIGGTHNRVPIVPVIPVTGIGYFPARNTFYDAVDTTGILTINSTFFHMRQATVYAAAVVDQPSVQQAWNAVGLSYNCTASPQAPQIQVWPDYCRGRHKITWNPVAGATFYDGQATPVVLGWGLAQTITNGDVTECKQNIPANTGDWWVRVRACNGCGCSAWSPQGLMEYWYTCQ